MLNAEKIHTVATEQELRTGEIIFRHYDAAWGRLRDLSTGQIFFLHMREKGDLVPAPALLPTPFVAVADTYKPGFIPDEGDVVLYMPTDSPYGPRARCWVVASDYREIVEQIQRERLNLDVILSIYHRQRELELMGSIFGSVPIVVSYDTFLDEVSSHNSPYSENGHAPEFAFAGHVGTNGHQS